MSDPGEQLAAAATALVGVPFRLHGRDPATGLDCVGLIEAALNRCGRACRLPNGYQLRNVSVAALLPDLTGIGLVHCAQPLRPGDVVLARLSPVQLHFAIAAPGEGWIHAHAGTGRIIHQLDALAGEILASWRPVERFAASEPHKDAVWRR